MQQLNLTDVNDVILLKNLKWS